MERHMINPLRPCLPFRTAGLQLADAAERYAAVSDVMKEDETQMRLALSAYADELLAFRHAIDEELARLGFGGSEDA
jgi:hypothetical protein